MTITKTADVEGTLQQIYALAAAGCDIVRCTCNEAEAAEGLAQIVPRSPVPVIADIHHQYRMALAALEAGVQGCASILGTSAGRSTSRPWPPRRETRRCRSASGSTPGSLDPALYERHGGVTPEAMVESAMQELAYFHEVDFDLVKISVKASSVPLMVEAYRQLADATDHPLHLGVTEAGPPPAGLGQGHRRDRHAAPRGHRRHDPLLAHRRSRRGGRAGRQLLEALGLRERKNVDLIACPSCGRAEIDVIDVAKRAMDAFGERQLPLQVAVMGCVVNGPGEAREADLGIAAGNKRGHLFVKGRNIAVVPETEMVDALVEWAEFINEHGVEAAIAKADTAKAEREAARDRSMLLDAKGADANHAAEKIVEIRKTVASDRLESRRWRCRRSRRLRCRGDRRGRGSRPARDDDDQLVGLGPPLGRAGETEQADRRAGEGIDPGGRHHRVEQRCRVHHLEHGVDVDRLGRQPARTTLSLAPINSTPAPPR